MGLYRKKPVIIEAYRWDDDMHALLAWSQVAGRRDTTMEIFRFDGVLTIMTLEGRMTAMTGDYIICGVKGEFYPCRSDIFHLTYESMEL